MIFLFNDTLSRSNIVPSYNKHMNPETIRMNADSFLHHLISLDDGSITFSSWTQHGAG